MPLTSTVLQLAEDAQLEATLGKPTAKKQCAQCESTELTARLHVRLSP